MLGYYGMMIICCSDFEKETKLFHNSFISDKNESFYFQCYKISLFEM